MIAIVPYLLKVILCSTLLTAYYYLALRNKLFHQWNRFYLIAAVFLSLLIPCFSFTISHTPQEAQSQVIQVLKVVSVSGPYEEELPAVPVSFFEAYGAMLLYISVSAVLLISLIFSLVNIYKLAKRHGI